MSGSLRAPNYHRRVIDSELDALAAGAAAISIEGAKGVGKSATAAERVDSEFRLESAPVRSLLEADPQRILNGGRVLLDQWQHLPFTWDLVRRAVDAGAAPGQFLLTGSASLADPGRHSGAGRILRLRMRPMALAERGYEPSVSLADLLTGSRPAITGDTSVDLSTYTAEIVASGFPGVRNLPSRIRRAQLDSYVERVVDRDFSELGTKVRNPSALKRWMRAYAAATATATTFTKIAGAAHPGTREQTSRTTLATYRDALDRLFILDSLPGWLPSNSHLSEVAASPKHHLVDPALAVALTGLDEEALLAGDDRPGTVFRDGPFLGALFESLVALCVRVYAQHSDANVCHFRMHRGDHEVDLMVRRRDGRCVALEVKLSPLVGAADVRHLIWLQQRLGPDLLDAAIITTGPNAYRRPDGVAVIPAALLGP
ncbi:MAG: ATP-binding protein [Acidimicrobiales bacterium]